MSADGGTNGAKGPEAGVVVVGPAPQGPPVPEAGAAAARPPGAVAPGSEVPPPVKVIEIYPAPDELPPPTFKQALVGYGSIILGLALLGVLLGVLMRVLR